MEAGIRFASNMYVRFIVDPDSGQMDVLVEVIIDVGVKREITGSVVWDE